MRAGLRRLPNGFSEIQKFFVVYQRRIFAQLFGRFPMAIEKLVERR